MSRLQVLIAIFALSPAARAACTIHAVGRVRVAQGQPQLVVFEGSMSETRLRITPAPGANHAELMLQLLGANGRVVIVDGSCPRPPQQRRGEVRTDFARVRLTLPDALKPNGGDELRVDPGATDE